MFDRIKKMFVGIRRQIMSERTYGFVMLLLLFASWFVMLVVAISLNALLVFVLLMCEVIFVAIHICRLAEENHGVSEENCWAFWQLKFSPFRILTSLNLLVFGVLSIIFL